MKKEVKDKWVEALRSGRYKQGMYRLRSSDNRYCCLGVLSDISDVGEWVTTPAVGFRYMDKYGTSANAHVLTRCVLEWSGIGDTSGYFSSSTSLSDINDAGKTFSEIADIIEKHWEKL